MCVINYKIRIFPYATICYTQRMNTISDFLFSKFLFVYKIHFGNDAKMFEPMKSRRRKFVLKNIRMKTKFKYIEKIIS